MIEINFNKDSTGLVPAIIQDSVTNVVLMLGYMNKEAYLKTTESGKVTFFSRSKNRLWVKGEESGNYLSLIDISVDCDGDTILIKAIPCGPTCHTGADTCWQETNLSRYGFITELETIIASRRGGNVTGSYITTLFENGINKIAQKVGEEAVEVVIEAKDDNDQLFLNECADLLFHYLILLQAKGYTFNDVTQILKLRNSALTKDN